ncbi:hypothetical protein MKK69_09240 [Methylobacterium sp. J-026]|jgi:hypothetical protein|uniref:hypothetical protein n=1 Tax=unclassified Methylobacterium TaxID=2615210 RepID=UPI0011CBC710|nr:MULTISPECIES: hypothetical protein [unclassified Methylobacterium]MCJ2134236.1 hypothetical protein [Methylobacterium sp. J-026]TXM71178.1 hypothetical protein FV229_00435 [Methylobacterium sp. WL120]
MRGHDLTLARIDDATVKAVAGGHELATTTWAPRVDGDRLTHFAAVAIVRETYAGWEPEDFQRANLQLHRAARDRLRELATRALRDAD